MKRALFTAGALVPSLALAAVLNVTWVHPTKYTDGAALPSSDIAGTRIEWGSCAAGGGWGSKEGETFIAAPATAAQLTVTGWGAKCVRAFTRTTAAAYAPSAESAASAVASKSIPAPLPAAPSAVTVQ